MGTWLCSELRKIKKEEEWYLTAITPFPVQVGSLKATSPQDN